MKYYIVTRDLQGGEFGMERAYTAKQWGEQAFDWADSDGSEEPEYWLIENHPDEQELINNIADYWELEFKCINEEQKKTYESYLKKLDWKAREYFSLYEKADIEIKQLLDKERINLWNEYDNFIESL